MIELLRSDDPVRLSFLEARLNEAGIACFLLDVGMASLYGGGLPQLRARLMVSDEDEANARDVIAAALKELE